MAREYNFIYTELVKGKDDILGHIAYSLYKAEKIEFIESFKKGNNREPNENELNNFHLASCSTGSLDRFRQMAFNILQDFTSETLHTVIDNVEEKAKANVKKYFQEALNEVRPPSLWNSYLNGIAQSVIGAFVFLILIAALIFALDVNKRGVTISLGNGSAEIQQTTTKDSLK